ncbi:MAG: hypothetical protein JO345_12365 [Streptosporangiaceae bacterium]|nr:hypothetical protein [Streptosporangiaceae bacterium]
MRSSHSSATAARCTFSTAFATAVGSRWWPLGYTAGALRSPNLAYSEALVRTRSPSS